MKEFFAMGGYGFFVWTCYALTFFILAINTIQAFGCERRAKRALEKRQRLDERREAREST